jgi:hypothetical protein
MLIQLIPEEVNAHPFYFLIHIFELKLERKESFIVNFIYNLYTLPSKKEKFSFAEWPKHFIEKIDWNILQQDFGE